MVVNNENSIHGFQMKFWLNVFVCKHWKSAQCLAVYTVYRWYGGVKCVDHGIETSMTMIGKRVQ